ncbi:MAG: hypothetical protein J2P38_05130 [Candidatus Dormibacteraeota bacterium]|nr:hypothetical protein [Candidatus Dormibacteraeota bacterium]
MSRVVQYRVHGVREGQEEALDAAFARLRRSRSWRGEPPWLALPGTRSLFEMEFLRHVREEEGEGIDAAGFLELQGDETDALILVLFLRDLSADLGLRVSVRDQDHPLSKLRRLDFQGGVLPTGNSLEQLLSRRPMTKKVDGRPIAFYAPSHPLNSRHPDQPVRWGYRVGTIRAFAPTLLEAEREALRLHRALSHLGA